MRRREFLGLVGGAAAARPFAARAQQPDGMRHISVMMSLPDERSSRAQADALLQGLQQLGWTDGRNISVDLHWDLAEPGRALAAARDIIAKRPDLICSLASPATVAVVQLTKTIPIVFGMVADPVSLGLVESFTRPGGNVTGFSNFDPSIGGKWVEVLKDLNAHIRRIAILFNPDTAPAKGNFFLPSFNAAGTAFGVKTIEAPVHDSAGIKQAIDALASEPDGGLVAMADAFNTANRGLIIQLAQDHRLPLIAAYRTFPDAGGLLSYGPNPGDVTHRMASYVDRILKGEKPADLPIQAPTKFEMVINLRTAEALGLAIPLAVLARADEVIE
jgi:putative tryptophan/tyrosine transport system substrate-binding protein